MTQLADAIGVAARLLDGHDARALGGQALNGVHPDLDAAAARDAVEDDRQLRGAGNGPEMLEQPFLHRLVVIRRHLERRVGSDLLRRLGQMDGFAGRVAAGAGDDLDPARHEFDRLLDDADVLVVVERR